MPNSAPIPLLTARGLTAALPGDTGIVAVLDELSLDLFAGEVVDLVGPSGSGKSTLLRSLARLMPPARGELFLDGHPAESIEPTEWRRRVALVPQVPALLAGTVGDNVRLPLRLKEHSHKALLTDEEVVRALAQVGLDTISPARDVSRLSVGQIARIALVRVMLTKPEVLLLDEADAALDARSSESVRGVASAFAKNGGAVLRVRHREDDALADRRLALADGRLTEVAR